MSGDPESIRSRLAIAGSERVFSLGCFEKRVTVYSQQVRALNLAWALSELGQLENKARIAVIGAGAAGLTAGLGLARKGGAVTIFERKEVLLPRFSGNTQRYLHPHVYDWPSVGSENRRAGLPVMDWTAGNAGEVVQQLRRAWAAESAGVSRITVKRRTTVSTLDIANRRIEFVGHESGAEPFDIVVLAVGVGTEPPLDGTPSYWENDALAQDFYGPSTVLVSGNGDGALIDVVRASLLDFDHAQLMVQLQLLFGPDDLSERVRKVEASAAADPSFDLDGAYSRLTLNRIIHFLSNRRRTERVVTWNTGEQLFRRDTMALNRVLVEALRRMGLVHWQGRVAKCQQSEGLWNVLLDNGESRSFDLALRRHGPKSDIERFLPGVRPNEEVARGAEDVARSPQWPSDYFSVTRPSFSNSVAPRAYDVVALDEGFGLESRAWWINSRGEVVGWTLLPEARDHAFFVWLGAGFPPTLGCIPGLSKMAAMSINDRGEYVVCSEGGSGQALLIGNAKVTVLPAHGRRAMAYSVNNKSEVVGWCDDEAVGFARPCLWRNGAVEFLEDAGHGGVALQINDAGDTVGEVGVDSNGHLAAARWRAGKLELFRPPPDYYSARAFRINASGTAVGYVMKNGHASDFFIWAESGEPTIVEQGEAYGVNNSGWLAGRAGVRGAFLYRDGRMTWLNELVDPRWHIIWPFCLTDDLRMVGVARRDGIERAVLLVPRVG